MKEENQKLFSEFPVPTYEQWNEEAVKLLKGAPFEKKMLTKTPEGITLKPIYCKEDVDFDVGLPGFDGYIRGTNAEGYRKTPWKISQEIFEEVPSEFNKILLDALNKGQNSVEIVLCEASANSKDADKADEKSLCTGGLAVSTAKDFADALNGVEVECVEVNIHTSQAGADAAALLYASKPGKKFSGGIYFDPISDLAKSGKISRSLKCAFDEMFALASYNSKNMPSFGAIGVDMMPYSSAGASAVQELGIAMATGVKYLREMLSRGMDIDEVAPLVRFRFSLGSNFFMEIAKLRAARALWSKVVSEFGGNAESQKLRANVRTSIYNKTVFDPYVNMLRTTTEAFSGVIGGCDGMTVGAFDEIVRRPDDFSRRIARNQQIILQEECNLTDVIDPAGGSYYVEILTREVAEASWKFFSKIEELGGIEKALEAGFVQDEIASVCSGRKKLIDGRRSSIVGTNNYANMTEKPLEVPSRDCGALAKKLAGLAESSRKDVEICSEGKSGAELMEVLVKAASCGASIEALGNAVCSCKGETSVKPLNIHRAVEHFEALRKASMDFKAKTGSGPKVFLSTMGPLVQFKVRADFIRGFFEVGAFDVIYPNGFETAEDAAKAFKESGAKYAVICSTDATYPELVPAVTKAIKAVSPEATVLLAGIPAPECEASYKEAGLDGSISIKSNNYETLKSMMAALGVLK